MHILIALISIWSLTACNSEPTADQRVQQDKIEQPTTSTEKAPASTKPVSTVDKKETEVQQASKEVISEKKVESKPTNNTTSDKPKAKKETPKKKEVKKPAPKPAPKPVEKPKIIFPQTEHNFGFINEGDTVRHTFRFLNDGPSPVEILDVQVSCGCTVPVYPLEPILPGRLGKIDVTFLSKGKIGSQLATIDVTTNAEKPEQTLILTGVIR